MFSVYLAWNSTHYRFFLCPPFLLDSIFCRSGAGRKGTGWGVDPVWTQLAALTPSLPIGIADYVLNYLADESEREPSGAKLCAAGKQVPPGIKASTWCYLGWVLKRRWPGTADFGEVAADSAGSGQMQGAVESSGQGQMSGEAGSALLVAVECLLRERRQLARQVLLSLEAETLPPGLRLDSEGYLRQLGLVWFLDEGQEATGPLNFVETVDALKYAAKPASLSNSADSICSSSVNLANSTDSAAELEAKLMAAGEPELEAELGAAGEPELEAGLLWVERVLAGRALLPKEVQTLLAENRDRLPTALRDGGFRNGEARDTSTGRGAAMRKAPIGWEALNGETSIGREAKAGATLTRWEESSGREASMRKAPIGWKASTGLEAKAGAGVWVPAGMQAAFQVLALQGRALLRPAVGRDLRGQFLCYRCGQSDQLKSAVCGHCGRRACYYCESCNSLGLARECLPLYLVPGAKPASGSSGSTADQEPERDLAAKFHTDKTVKPLEANQSELEPEFKPEPDPELIRVINSASFQLDFSLTPAQQRAAEEVRQFVTVSPLKQCLVWAVCGAGKTEVVFPALAEALARGGPVLYTTPRRDVVQELAPRLKQAFPSFRVSQLYAGSGDRFAPADIYTSTTHQTLRFYQNFDLVILDEVDAYPYRDSPLLHYAVLRASRPGGKIIYLTATPTAAMQQQARAGRELAVVYIPARHHGFPVPEPELIGESRLRWPSGDPNSNRNRNRNRNSNRDRDHKLELPGSVVDLIQRALAENREWEQVRELAPAQAQAQAQEKSQEKSQLLIFVPAVRLAGIVAEAVSRQVEFDKLKWPMELDKLANSAKSAVTERPIKLERRGEPVKQIEAVKQAEKIKQVKQIEQVEQTEKNNRIRQIGKIEQVKQVEPTALPWWVQASHAGDPQREQKRQSFSQGDFPILVTTTILERGITIPRVNVIVLFADAEKIFDEGSLVQMAGRVGRTTDFPQGKVWLVGSRVSPAMRSAQARIREMNRRARALGFLHEGRGEHF